MSQCTVSGTLLDPSSTAISGAIVKFNIQNPVTGILSPQEVRTSSATDGTWSLAVSQGVTGIFTVESSEDSKNSNSTHTFNAVIPSSSTATFSSVWVD